jgi:hypothetical protein
MTCNPGSMECVSSAALLKLAKPAGRATVTPTRFTALEVAAFSENAALHTTNGRLITGIINLAIYRQ